MLRRLWYHINFPVYIQRNSSDCGIECLRMILAFHKLPHSYQLVSKYLSFDAFGTNFKSIQDASYKLGLEALAVKVSLKELISINPLPAILHWNNDHFVVLYKISDEYAWIVDPAKGILKLSIEDFVKNSLTEDQMQVPKGTILLFQKLDDFEVEPINDPMVKLFSLSKSVWKETVISLITGLCIAFLLSLVHLSLPLKGQLKLEFDKAYFILASLALVIIYIAYNVIKSFEKTSSLNKDIERCFYVDPNSDLHSNDSIFNSLDCYYKLSYHKLNRSKFWLSISIITGVLVFMIYMPAVLGLVTFVSCMIFLIIKLYALRESEKRTAACISEASTLQKEVIGYYDKTKTLLQSGKSIDDKNELYTIFKDRKSTLPWKSYNRLLNAILIIVVAIIILLIDEKVINTSQGIIGSLSVFISLISLDLVSRYLWNFNNISYLNRTDSVQESKPEIVKDIKLSSFEIELNNLDYSYPSQNWNASLKNLNVSVPFGTKLAIMGSSGSGKSSFLKLISGILEPTSGEIKIGNIATTHYSNNELSKYIGFLNEETKLVPGSIAWNITLESSYDKNRLKSIIKDLYLDYIIEGLNDGLDTNIDDEEVYLSPTMILKILLARLVYLNKPIMIIDLHELDVNDVHHLILYESLFSLCKDKTLLFVTSDVELAQSTDKIIYMEDGEIVEQGSYKDLILKNELFANYIRQQKMIRT